MGKLHPSGEDIYSANDDVSPSEIEKLSVRNGVVEPQYNSPYHGHYEMGGNLWFSDGGERLFTQAGNVFISSDNQETDMTYTQRFSGIESIRDLDHSSIRGEIAVIEEDDKNDIDSDDQQFLTVFNDDQLNRINRHRLPTLHHNQSVIEMVGEYVFYDINSTNIYVVLSSNTQSANDSDKDQFAVWKLSEH